MTNPQRNAAFAAHVTTLAASLDTLNYYQLLGLAQNASADDIKRAFHRVASIYHPDAHRGADPQVHNCLTKIFKRMGEGYRILNDFSRRKLYDAQLHKGGSGRMVEKKREKTGPKRPDAGLKNPMGKKYFLMALDQIKRKDLQGAKLNLSLAQNYEGKNSEPIKAKIAEVDELLKK